MGRVARGDDDLLLGEGAALPSELPGVPDAAWDAFARAMQTAKLSDVSEANAVGMFELTPRRLADLGIVEKLARRRRGEGNPAPVFTARFVPPMTAEKFLRDPDAQYRAFARSIADYDRRLASGEIAPPADESLGRAGQLAVLHRAGPRGLLSWDRGERFPQTTLAAERARGLF